jgi:hypothetical protein
VADRHRIPGLAQALQLSCSQIDALNLGLNPRALATRA